MKTKIKISGAIFGNSHLLQKLRSYTTYTKGMFNSIYVEYDTKVEAQKDLGEAWKLLKEEYYPEKVSGGGIYRDKGGRPYKVNYDASTAEILE